MKRINNFFDASPKAVLLGQLIVVAMIIITVFFTVNLM